jgi:hypothetical protein
MMETSSARAQDIGDLTRAYVARRLAIRENPELSWEKKELSIKALREEYYRQLRKLGGGE